MDEKKTLLIAEDDWGNFRYLQVLLQNEFEILWAQNGEEAIKMALKNDVDMVLMDNKMPVTDGLQAMIAIKKVKPDLPIVMQTAFAFEADKKTAFKAGADAYLTKPILCDQLHQLIAEFRPRMMHKGA